MNAWAIIVAAGQGARMLGQGIGLPKQFMPLTGKPLFWHGALALAGVPALRGIVFVLPHEWPQISANIAPPYIPPQLADPNPAAPFHEALLSAYEIMIKGLDRLGTVGLPWKVVLGGKRRQDSVFCGLSALPHDCDAVLVHDGARPFVSTSLGSRVLEALLGGAQAVVPGLPVTDTVKEIGDQGRVIRTLQRSSLRAAQTPQGFSLPVLRKAYCMAEEKGWDVTDDASLIERAGGEVLVVPGEETNHKITRPEDLYLLQKRSAEAASCRSKSGEWTGSAIQPCSGIGYDVHRYGGERPFILGGVPIACDIKVKAHSDGDTLLHALMDAMLGCIGGGDIGLLFPDSDPELDNISSGILLSEVLERCRRAGLVITGIDITIIAQIPRIAPHRQAIAANLAKMLQIPPHAVNVKATTEEGLGFTGEKKGIKVLALVSGLRPAAPPPANLARP